MDFLFKDIDQKDRAKLTKETHFETVKYKKGEMVAAEGELCTKVGLVVSGELVIKNIYYDGNETIIRLVNPKELFGEILLFSSHPYYPAAIYATIDSQVQFIDHDNLMALMDKNHIIALNVLREISDRFIDLNERIKILSRKTIKGKLCHYLHLTYLSVGSTSFKINLNKEQLAKFLNVERPSLSREFIKLKNENIIDYKGKNITIKNLPELETYL